MRFCIPSPDYLSAYIHSRSPAPILSLAYSYFSILGNGQISRHLFLSSVSSPPPSQPPTNRIRHVPSVDRHRVTPCIVNLAALIPALPLGPNEKSLWIRAGGPSCWSSHQPLFVGCVRFLSSSFFYFYVFFSGFAFALFSAFPRVLLLHSLLGVPPPVSLLLRSLPRFPIRHPIIDASASHRVSPVTSAALCWPAVSFLGSR